MDMARPNPATIISATVDAVPIASQIPLMPHAARAAHVVRTASRTPPRNTATVVDCACTPYSFAIATAEADYLAAQGLVEQCYAWRGYRSSRAAGLTRGTTLLALAGEAVVGTMSVRVDQFAGLLCEAQYPLEIAMLRRSGAQLCELGQLAVAHHSRPLEVIAPLFHISHLLAHEGLGCSDYVIEVNPRHAGFYARAFGFEQIGNERICERVGAPAVLMRLSAEFANKQIDALGGTRSAKRSAFAFCFGEDEAQTWRHTVSRTQRSARPRLSATHR